MWATANSWIGLWVVPMEGLILERRTEEGGSGTRVLPDYLCWIKSLGYTKPTTTTRI